MTVEEKLEQAILAAKEELTPQRAALDETLNKEKATYDAEDEKYERCLRLLRRLTLGLSDLHLQAKLEREIRREDDRIKKLKQKGKNPVALKPGEWVRNAPRESTFTIDFDLAMYYYDRLAELKTPEFVYKHNPRYCNTVLATLGNEFSHLKLYCEQQESRAEAAYRKHTDDEKTRYKDSAEKAWNELSAKIAALAKEKAAILIDEIDRSVNSSVKEIGGKA